MNDERAKAGKAPKPAKTLAREERLAAQLRENLRRRKAQARALSADTVPNHEDESVRLPKTPPES